MSAEKEWSNTMEELRNRHWAWHNNINIWGHISSFVGKKFANKFRIDLRRYTGYSQYGHKYDYIFLTITHIYLSEVRTFKLETVLTSPRPTLTGYTATAFTSDFPFIEQAQYSFIFTDPHFLKTACHSKHAMVDW